MTLLVIYFKMSVYTENISHIQLNSRQIILFRLKSHRFQHTSCRAYMIRYNNVSRPVHDPPLRLSSTAPSRDTPKSPMIDAYGTHSNGLRWLMISPDQLVEK